MSGAASQLPVDSAQSLNVLPNIQLQLFCCHACQSVIMHLGMGKVHFQERKESTFYVNQIPGIRLEGGSFQMAMLFVIPLLLFSFESL